MGKAEVDQSADIFSFGVVLWVSTQQLVGELGGALWASMGCAAWVGAGVAAAALGPPLSVAPGTCMRIHSSAYAPLCTCLACLQEIVTGLRPQRGSLRMPVVPDECSQVRAQCVPPPPRLLPVCAPACLPPDQLLTSLLYWVGGWSEWAGLPVVSRPQLLQHQAAAANAPQQQLPSALRPSSTLHPHAGGLRHDLAVPV